MDRVDLGSRPFRLWADGVEYRAQAVIVATGADALWLGIESETRLRGRGVSACATCDGFFFRDKEIAVVGGGDSALEEALYLTRFASKVHLIHRRDAFRGSKIMQDRAATHPKVELHLNRTIEEVLGTDHVEALRLGKTDEPGEERLAIQGLFVAIGHRPNVAVFRDWLEMDEKGYLRNGGATTASNIDGVFVAGDVDDHRYRQAVTAAGEGCRAAIDAERWLEAQETHEPSRHRALAGQGPELGSVERSERNKPRGARASPPHPEIDNGPWLAAMRKSVGARPPRPALRHPPKPRSRPGPGVWGPLPPPFALHRAGRRGTGADPGPPRSTHETH